MSKEVKEDIIVSICATYEEDGQHRFFIMAGGKSQGYGFNTLKASNICRANMIKLFKEKGATIHGFKRSAENA